VQGIFRRAANSLADQIQTRAIATLKAFITAADREIDGNDWGLAVTDGVMNTDPATLPHADFAKVAAQFAKDKVGVQPDLMILHPDDLVKLQRIYGGDLQKILEMYGLEAKSTPQATVEEPIFVKRGAVGAIAFEKPLDQEYERDVKRKTDVFVLEAVPVIVAYDAGAVLQVDVS